ncbi:MAG TPA: Nif3-like dinuclear metal center hexameric protein [Flavobacteriales bacterium]|nr:Nif3-like dinuclear metal center hexameric protein [Flavobacteriales bacterium]HIN39630.1 Nif3-like dinuclear metal center hexameric protein [Flavobacteriales bacterium]
MRLSELIKFLEELAPLQYQESYDNSGLLYGNPNRKITKALISLDCTEEVVNEAIKKKCDLIVSHHPLIFGGISSLTGKNYVERTFIKAIQKDIALYAIHTNLDNVKAGVNAKITQKLGMKDCQILTPKKGLLKKLITFCPAEKVGKVRAAIFEAGAGNISDYSECSFNSEGYGTFKGNEGTDPVVGVKGKQNQESEIKIESIFPKHSEGKILEALFHSHPYEEVAYDIIPLDNQHKMIGSGMIGLLHKEMDEKAFLKKIKTTMRCKSIRYTALRKKKVKTVAVCGGSGSFLLADAIRNKADFLITADFKYHQFFDAEGKIVIADIGHYESEQFTKDLLYDLINKKFPKFALRLSEINTNPINYY